jgi:prolyl-tRNA editing enzyme YbaK/EbsC (Cys-tRNA(Pro) deacylase)
MHDSARRVQEELLARGHQDPVMEMPESTRSAQDAAAAIGCAVGQIAKSLVFRGERTGDPILVIASGANRVDEKLLAGIVYEPVMLPDGEFVRLHTGFAIGGVPPLAHPEPMTTIIDEDLMQHAEIWAAAGTPRAVFKLTPAQLVDMTGGHVARVRAG